MGRVEMHHEAFDEMRKDPKLRAALSLWGQSATDELNAELAAAQERREQSVEPGYESSVVAGAGHTRARLYIAAATARAQAHEKAHDSLLKWAFGRGGKAARRKR